MLRPALKYLCCLAVLFGLLSFGTLPLGAASPPPANDLCSGAVVIPPSGPFPYLTTVIPDISGATTNGEPIPDPDSFCVTNISQGVWYKFTPAAAGRYFFSFSFDTATTIPDTAMAIYISSGACSGPFTLLDCNDDQSGFRSAMEMNLSANVTYYILVWSAYNPAQPDQAAVQLRVSKPVPPPNDTCAGAIVIPAAGPFPFLTATSDIAVATSTGDPAIHSCQGVVTNSVWYRFTPSVTGYYLISTDTNTATTVYDTVMALYTASGNCSGFTEVECNDVVEGRASITRNLTAGIAYYIVVWDADPFSPIPGETLVQVRVASVAKPSVITGPPTSLSTSNALGVASVNPNSGLTRVWFEWGTTTSYGSRTTARLVGSGSTALITNDLLTGLTAGTTYHYRAVATNAVGTTLGNDFTFKWSAAQPHITTYSRLSNGTYRIQFTATTGQLYKVESANVLGSWSELGAATDVGNNLFEFVDTQPLAPQTRFYRVKAP